MSIHSSAIRGPDNRPCDLFIVHASEDEDFVYGELLPALGIARKRVCLLSSLELAALIPEAISRSVTTSGLTVVVLSPSFAAGHWAPFSAKLATADASDDARAVPLLLADCHVELYLAARVGLDFRDSSKWGDGFAHRRDKLALPKPSREMIPSPYVGPEPFRESDAKRFFGRET